MFRYTRLSFAHQFLLLSLFLLVSGMVIIGMWVQAQIKRTVANHTAAVTALYVDSFVSPHVQGLRDHDTLEPADIAALDSLLTNTPLGQQIVSFKIWSSGGEVLYSLVPELIGRRFDITHDLARAATGEVTSELSYLTEEENSYERESWDSLIETYAPIRLDNEGEILAVAEFYQRPEALLSQLRIVQTRSWLVVGLATLIMYLLLAGMVHRTSNLIVAQQATLEGQLSQLNAALSDNEKLRQRIQRAASRATALNERFLERVSADLHDGPAQSMSLALLRLGALAEACGENSQKSSTNQRISRDLKTVQTALVSALSETRAIAENVQLPEVGRLSIEETARRVVRDYERLTGGKVDLSMEVFSREIPLSVRITLYRLLQEALSNGFRHSEGKLQSVSLIEKASDLVVEIRDDGKGFHPESQKSNRSLGLTGMQTRVELLGGEFALESSPGQGTTIRARLPLNVKEGEEDV